MKRNLVSIALLLLFAQFTNAQYCGAPVQCAADTLHHVGLWPADTGLAPFVNGDTSSAVITMLGTDTLTFGSHTLICDSIVIDTIYQVPEGLCWSMDELHHTYVAGSRGCIKISGIACVPPGQYPMLIGAHFYAPFSIGDQIYYNLRVVNRGESAPPVDTGASDPAAPILYGPSAICWPLAINNAYPIVPVSVTVSPDPFSANAQITVSGLNSGFNFEMYDMVGRLCRKIETIRQSTFDLPRNDLASGVYWYRITRSGQQFASGKLMIQ